MYSGTLTTFVPSDAETKQNGIRCFLAKPKLFLVTFISTEIKNSLYLNVVAQKQNKRAQRALDRLPEKQVKTTPDAPFENKGQLNLNNFCTVSPRKFLCKIISNLYQWFRCCLNGVFFSLSLEDNQMTLHTKYQSIRSCYGLSE